MKTMLYILPVALLSVIVAAVVTLKGNSSTQPVDQAPAGETAQNAPMEPQKPRNPQVNLVPKLVAGPDGGSILQLWLQPQTENQLTALAFKATVSANGQPLQTSANEATIEPAFDDKIWTFPFKTVTVTPEGSLALEVSALYFSSDRYTLPADQTLLLSVPVNVPPTTTLTVTIDPSVSKLLNENAQELHFINEGESIPVANQ